MSSAGLIFKHFGPEIVLNVIKEVSSNAQVKIPLVRKVRMQFLA
jgi:uncharacterized UPF0160 family protein